MSGILRRDGGDEGEHPVIEAELDQFAHEARRMAAGGWKRAAIGFALGATAGLLAALVLPREDGPRRTVGDRRPKGWRAGRDRPRPFDGRER